MTVHRTTLLYLGAAIFAVATMAVPAIAQAPDESPPGQLQKNDVDIDVRSHGNQIREAVQQGGTVGGVGAPSVVPGGPVAPQIQTRGGNVQVNDPGLDNIQILSFGFPLVKFTQQRDLRRRVRKQHRRDLQLDGECELHSGRGFPFSSPLRPLDLE